MARAAVALREKRYATIALRAFEAYSVNKDADTGYDVFVPIHSQGDERDPYYWIYKAGLLLRSLESLEVLAERRLLKLKPVHWAKLTELQKRAVAYIGRTVHTRGSLYELFTCHRSTETNSETQAWALLGLHRIEHERAEGR